jgi:hypothetical protein
MHFTVVLGCSVTSFTLCGGHLPSLSSMAVNAGLTRRMCYLLIYLRPLLLNEPFVVTVDTPVRITTELLLLVCNGCSSVSMEVSLRDSKHVTVYSVLAGKPEGKRPLGRPRLK